MKSLRLLILGIALIIPGYANSQNPEGSKNCLQFLLKDLFVNTSSPKEHRKDDIVYLKLIKKQFDYKLKIQSYNQYHFFESFYKSVCEAADMSCLAIGEVFETTIVLDFEESQDTIWKLPTSQLEIDKVVEEFQSSMKVTINPERLWISFGGIISCGPGTRSEGGEPKTMRLKSLKFVNAIAEEIDLAVQKINALKQKR